MVDRLCQKKLFEQIQDDEELFSPKILPRSQSLKREQDVSKLLHSDALRRQEKKDFIEAEKATKLNHTPKINRNTQDLVCKKILAEFDELVPEGEK